MGVNGTNLQDLFNQRFGANAYQNGVNAAQQAGQNYYNAQVQAAAQKMFDQMQAQQDAANKAAAAAQAKLQKPVTDLKNAADYWNDPTNNQMLHDKGAWRVVQDLNNDPEMQAQLKAQGYDPKAIADQAYNVATNGQIKSAAGFKDFYNSQKLDSATTKANQADLQNQIDVYNQTKKDTGETDAQIEAADWKKIQQNGVDQALSAAGQNGLDAQQQQTKNYNDALQKEVTNSGVGNFGDELYRGLGRATNAASLGLLGQLFPYFHNGEQFQPLMDRGGTGGNIDKASDFLGSAVPFALTDGALGAANVGAGLAEKGIAGKLGQAALTGGLSGGITNAIEQGIRAGGNALNGNPNQFDLGNAAKELGLNTLLGGAGGVALHGLGMVGGKVLDNAAGKLYQDMGYTPTNAETFTPGTATNDALTNEFKNITQTQLQPKDVLKFDKPQPLPMIGKTTLPGNQSEVISNIAQNSLDRKPIDVSNNNWFAPAQQGSTIQGRGILQDTSLPKAQNGAIRSIGEDALNKANTFSNAPAEGFNQRLLNVQQEMKGLQNNAQALAEHNGSNYEPNVENLYQQVRQPNDPKSFDDLVKMAQMEHGAANPSLTSMLRQDPRIKQGINALNDLGKPSTKASKVEVPTPKAEQTPKDFMQGLYSDRGKPKVEVPTPSGKSGVSNDLLLSAKVSPLKSIKTSKLVETMNASELNDVMAKLNKQEELLSAGGKGSEAKLKAVQEDKQKVSDLLMKLDLQQHAANPFEAVKERIMGKTPEKTPQDTAREHAQVNSAVKKLEEKGNPTSKKTVEEIQNMKDIKPFQKHTLNSYELFNKLPSEMGNKLTKVFDEGKANHVDNFIKRREDLYNKVVKELGIKKGSKDSAMVQDYGEKTLGKRALETQGKDPSAVSKEELNKINESELNRLAGSKADDIRAADKYIRNSYDQQIKEVNAKRAEIYPNNPDKQIPKREDYYHHFNELNGFDSFKNMMENNHGIDPHLAGISQNTKPKTKWAAPWQQRGNGEYKSDAVGGALKYLNASSYATHIDPVIAHIRNEAENLATATEGTKNLNEMKAAMNLRADELAGKTNELDRAVQSIVGRKVWNVVNTVNSHIKKNKILGNLGSVLGVAGNVPAVVGVTKQYAVKALPAAMKDFFSSVFNHGHIDGIAAESKFLKERYMNEGSYKFETSPLKKAENNAALMIEAGDKAAAFLAWHGSYQQALAKKLEGDAAIKFADNQARHLMAGRGIGERPLYQTSKITHMVAPFSLEVGQLWKILGKQAEGKWFGKGSKDYTGLATFVVGSAIYNHVMQQIRGSGTGYDPLGSAIEGWNDPKNLTTGDKVHGAAANLLGETISEIPGMANVQKAIGLTKSSDKQMLFGNKAPDRFGSGTGAISDIRKPIMDALGGDFKNTAYDLLPLLMPFGGSQAAKTAKGIEALSKGGAYNKAGNLEFPISASNPADLLQALAFGPNATKSGQTYFNEHGAALSPKDTQSVQSGLKNYDAIMQQRAQNAIKTQIAKVRNDKTLDPNQKLQKIAILMQKMQQGK